MIEILEKKKLGLELTKDEIDFFVTKMTNGEIPDYQTSALLMAIRLNGMTDEEINFLTFAMRDSGEQSDLSQISGIKVDKHSTGGVADTTTLITLPIAAACGVKIAKMSGRGLGHTGGTLDKLAAIPGYRATATPAEMRQRVEQCGICLVGQSGEVAPADKKLYALRDVTATVDSLPLIASSIMSKKLASGSDALILDVKMGSGALLHSEKEAKELATTLCRIGNAAGMKTRALVTDMNQPLGRAIGNALEVKEAIHILETGEMTALTKVALALASQMIQLSEIEPNPSDAMLLAIQALNNGSALVKLKEMILAHGGLVEDLQQGKFLQLSPHQLVVKSQQTGYLSQIEVQQLGLVAMKLGAGRSKADDEIDLGAGIWFEPRLGDFIKEGDPIATLYTSKPELLPALETQLRGCLTLTQNPPKELPKTIYGLYQ